MRNKCAHNYVTATARRAQIERERSLAAIVAVALYTDTINYFSLLCYISLNNLKNLVSLRSCKSALF